MFNVFQNIRVEAARTETNAGQFRHVVKFGRRVDAGTGQYDYNDIHWDGPGVAFLILQKEFVIDTTDDLSECLAVAEAMVKEANAGRYCFIPLRQANKKGGS